MNVAPRWLAIVWIVSGSVTAVASLVAGVAVWVLVGNVAAGTIDAATTTRELLATVSTATEELDTVVTEATGSLRDIQGTLTDASLTLTRASVVVHDLGDVVAVEVPDAIDAVSEAMPGLVDAARVVDSTMRALSFLGVDTTTDVPLATSLSTIDERLRSIPPLLRDRRDTIDAVADDLGAFGSSTTSIGDDVGVIRSKLSVASSTVGEASAVAARADAVLARVQDQAVRGRTTARALAAVLAIGFAIVQTLPIFHGVRALRSSDVPSGGLPPHRAA